MSEEKYIIKVTEVVNNKEVVKYIKSEYGMFCDIYCSASLSCHSLTICSKTKTQCLAKKYDSDIIDIVINYYKNFERYKDLKFEKIKVEIKK